jgi:RimJ/RimL family protein N-acetyltransferase
MNGDIGSGLIETERLVLREWTADDLGAMADGLNNENVAKYLTKPPYPYTMKDAESFFSSLTENTKGKMNFAITLKQTGAVIGGCGYKLSDGVPWGGIWTNEKYHGHGYGTEAYRALIKFIFDTCEADKVESGYFFDNAASKKMHEKIGFRPNGETETHNCVARGCAVQCYIAEIRKDWLK